MPPRLLSPRLRAPAPGSKVEAFAVAPPPTAHDEVRMYFEIIQQFARTLKNLDAILEKATRSAEARKFEVDNFLTARLAPDMLPFPSQIRIACDVAKTAAATLAG